MDNKRIETDVLVIGGGGAGLCAAVEARKKGADVILLCKKESGKSGCTPYAVTNITRVTPQSEAEMFRQMVEVGGYLNDQELVDVFVREAAIIVPGLSQYGVPMTIADGSHYHLENYPEGPQENLPGIYNVTPGPGRPLSFNLTMPLREAAEKLGVRIMDNHRATRLLVGDGAVAGATVLDNETGALIPISAKAVVIATGGSARIYERSDNPVDLTGDGFFFAFEAGAELINMELMAFNPLKITPEVLEMIKTGKPTESLMASGRAHYNLGGIHTDAKAESTVKNLYAAGEVADGMLGAARLGGTALADALVFGTIAGREAGGRVASVKRYTGIDDQVAAETARIRALTTGQILPADHQKQVKSVMWTHAGMAKTEASLTEAVKRLSALKATAMTADPADPKQVAHAVEAHLMAAVGEMIAVCSLQRRETRGQFWRLDHPKPDNANCLFNVILSKDGDSFAIRTRKPPVTRMRVPAEHPLVGSGCFNYLKPQSGR
jgi:succinate dehydrogenase/fumarate reductase flavoprotein subunit